MNTAPRYAVRHWSGEQIVEHWFATRDDRTQYLMEQGLPPLLSWEDPANDVNMTNVYASGKAV